MNARRKDSCQASCMEDTLEEPPSLLHLSMISFSIKLWTEQYIIDYMKTALQENSLEDTVKYLKTLEIIVADQLTNISIPNFLKDHISKYILTIGTELLKHIFEMEMYSIVPNRNAIRWTMKGIVNRAETAKQLIKNKDNNEDSLSLFKLACEYCLEDCISDLWKEFGPFNNIVLGSKSKYKEDLVSYWISRLQNEESEFLKMIRKHDKSNIYDRNQSISVSMLTLSAAEGNAFAVKYFLRKLDTIRHYNEKKYNIKNWLIKAINDFRAWKYSSMSISKNYDEIICHLLPEFQDKIGLNELFQTNSFTFLEVFCKKSPVDRSYMSVILSCIYKHMEFDEIIFHASHLLSENFSGDEIFQHLWLLAPLQKRKDFIKQSEYSSSTINNLLKYGFIESVELMLNDLSSASSLHFKEQKIDRLKVYKKLLKFERYDIIDRFLHWYFKTKEEKDEFKKEFISEVNSLHLESLLLRISCKGHFALKSFEKFISFTSLSPEELSQTRRLFLNFVERLLKVFAFDFATILLNWCLSANEVNRFKNELMTSEKGIDLLIHCLTYFEEGFEFEMALEWFYPFSSEVIAKIKSPFKSKFLTFSLKWLSEEKRTNAIHLLESYATK